MPIKAPIHCIRDISYLREDNYGENDTLKRIENMVRKLH